MGCLPAPSNNPSFTWMNASGWPSVGTSRYARTLRKCCCAMAVPVAPTETPNTPAGLPILVHPVLQEFLAVCTDVAGPVKQPILYLDECFGLAKRRYVQVRENIAQMLLCHGRAGGTDRNAQHTGGLARPCALAIGTRGVVDRGLGHAGDRDR